MTDNSDQTQSKDEISSSGYGYEWVKLKKDQKTDNFDFFEFSEHLSNSITDALYRSYLPPIEKLYRKNQEEYKDDQITNDMAVREIVKGIREKTQEEIIQHLSLRITKEVIKDLEEQYHPSNKIEQFADGAIKYIRWLMIPSFMLISVVVFCIFLVIGAKTVHLFSETMAFIPLSFSVEIAEIKSKMNDIVASILAILDLILIGSLVVMVLIGGYENTISRIGMSHGVPTWFGKLDIGQLKIKVAASIVIISSIHLLMAFMQLELTMKDFDPEPLKWTAIIHGVFVLSALTLASMDWISRRKSSTIFENSDKP